jgi:hypothetical protein
MDKFIFTLYLTHSTTLGLKQIGILCQGIYRCLLPGSGNLSLFAARIVNSTKGLCGKMEMFLFVQQLVHIFTTEL